MAATTLYHHIRNSDNSGANDWRCRSCCKLLGKREGRRVHVQFARGHRYIASTPMTAVCRCCGALNELI